MLSSQVAYWKELYIIICNYTVTVSVNHAKTLFLLKYTDLTKMMFDVGIIFYMQTSIYSHSYFHRVRLR